MKRLATQVLLCGAGLLLMFIGGSLLLQPHDFFAANGVVLSAEPSLLSEIRGPAGLLLAGGLVAAAGAVRPALTTLGLGVSAVVYGSYGFSRLVSLGLDGVPAEGLVSAMAIELLVGTLSLVALLTHGPDQATTI